MSSIDIVAKLAKKMQKQTGHFLQGGSVERQAAFPVDEHTLVFKDEEKDFAMHVASVRTIVDVTGRKRTAHVRYVGVTKDGNRLLRKQDTFDISQL